MLVKIVIIALVVAVGANEVEDEVNKYTLHLHPRLRANLNLTTGELKLFAGHAMNMIQAKCPSVNADKVFQVQKYIGKLIAKAGPVQGQSEQFKKLLDTVTQCTKEGVRAEATTPEPKNYRFFDSILAPFHHIRTFWVQRTSPETVPEESKDESQMSGVAPEAVKPTLASIPEDSSDPAGATEVNPIVPLNNKHSGRGIVAWIRNMFRRMGTTFHGMFGYPIRKRRDVSEAPEEVAPASPQVGGALELAATSGDDDVQIYFQPSEPEIASAVTPTQFNRGKKAFAELVDHMCHIYCSACTHPAEILKFKMASKQLLIFLFSEGTSLELGANKFLDQDFLNSITQCERGQYQ